VPVLETGPLFAGTVAGGACSSWSQWPHRVSVAWSWFLEHTDRGFESRSRHGHLSTSFCVHMPCVGRGLATGWSPVQGVVPTSHMWGGQGPSRTEPRSEPVSAPLKQICGLYLVSCIFHSTKSSILYLLSLKVLWAGSCGRLQTHYEAMTFYTQLNSSFKMTVFWDVAPCSLVEVYRRFRGACCLWKPEISPSKAWMKAHILVYWQIIVRFVKCIKPGDVFLISRNM
jgi:hypothetical protein